MILVFLLLGLNYKYRAIFVVWIYIINTRQ